MQEKQLLNYQNTKYKPSSTNLASVESWGEAQSYTFPAFSLWIVSSRSVPPQEQAKCTGRDTSLTFHWDILPGSYRKCLLGVDRDTSCYTFPMSISPVPALAWHYKWCLFVFNASRHLWIRQKGAWREVYWKGKHTPSIPSLFTWALSEVSTCTQFHQQSVVSKSMPLGT